MAIETTYTQVRASLKAILDRVVSEREPVIIRRRNGGDVALIAADELSGLLETVHLLRSPRNARRLLAALERSKRRKGRATSLTTLRADVGLDGDD